MSAWDLNVKYTVSGIILILGAKKTKLFLQQCQIKTQEGRKFDTVYAATKYANVLCTLEIGADRVIVWQL